MRKDFLNISRQECKEVYNDILENSEKHFKVAELLAKDGEYGFAVSHRVLGSEELVKALIIYFDGLGSNIRKVKGVKKFFKDHETRHMFSAMFGMITIMIPPLNDMFNKIKQFRQSSKKMEDMDEFEKALLSNDDNSTEFLLKEWAKGINEELKEEAEDHVYYWLDANDYKMKGFYVDYDFDLRSPKDITEDDYDEAFEATEFFRQNSSKLINHINSISEKEKKELIKTFANDKDIFDFFSLFTKKDPLPLAKE